MKRKVEQYAGILSYSRYLVDTGNWTVLVLTSDAVPVYRFWRYTVKYNNIMIHGYHSLPYYFDNKKSSQLKRNSMINPRKRVQKDLEAINVTH